MITYATMGVIMRFLTGPILFFWEIAKIVIISLAIIVPIRFFVIQPFFVRGASMFPSLNSGDYLIINEIGYRFNEPKRGEVVVFRPPQNSGQFYIKRVIGLPGEVVKIENGEVWLGKSEVSLEKIAEKYVDGRTLGQEIVQLKAGEYFVLGDNRNASSDSRNWGVLPRENIIGKAWIRAWPLDKFEIISNPIYGLDVDETTAELLNNL